MKILIVSQYYFPEQFQVNEIAPELVKRGHAVTVFCGVPNYPKGEVFPGYETEDGRAEKDAEYLRETGVKIVHVNQVPRGHNPLKLLLNYWSFMRNGNRAVAKLPGDFDVVIGYQLSPITSMQPALLYKKLHGTPVLFYTLDLWPVSAEAILKSKKNPIFPLAAKLSRKIYAGADRILVTSHPFIDYLKHEDGVEESKLAYLPQHAGTEMLDMDLTAEDNGVADFMFAGNLGNVQSLDTIVRAAEILGARDDYMIHFVGDGRMRQKLETMVAEKGLQKNFIFHGNQKRVDMPSFYRKSDALLITLRGDNEVGDTMPGKLQMYMTTGKPIFGAINGAAKEVIEESQCGKCVFSGDYEGLAQLMLSYIESPSQYQSCGSNARIYFKQHFTLENYLKVLEEELWKLKS